MEPWSCASSPRRRWWWWSTGGGVGAAAKRRGRCPRCAQVTGGCASRGVRVAPVTNATWSRAAFASRVTGATWSLAVPCGRRRSWCPWPPSRARGSRGAFFGRSRRSAPATAMAAIRAVRRSRAACRRWPSTGASDAGTWATLPCWCRCGPPARSECGSRADPCSRSAKFRNGEQQ